MVEINTLEPISIQKSEALPIVDEYLTELPTKKALAIRRGINFLENNAKHPSLLDWWKPGKVNPATRALKKPSPAVELRSEIRRIHHHSGYQSTQEKSAASPLVDQTSDQILAEGTLSEGMSLREISNLFDPVLGILKVPANLEMDKSIFADFYIPERRVGDFKSRQGEIELSGERSHVAYVKETDFKAKLSIIRADILRALDFVEIVNNDRSKLGELRDYLAFLGIADLLKTHSLTLFHLATYEERDFKFPEDDPVSYFDRKMQSMSLMEDSVKVYYQTLLGVDFDQNLDVGQMRENFGNLVDGLDSHLASEAAKKREPVIGRYGAPFSEHAMKSQSYKFKTPETENPLVMALGIQEAVRLNPDVDVIVGIPTGGTEVAVIAQLFYKLKNQTEPSTFFLPVSMHSEGHANDLETVSSFLARYFPGVFDSKKILLVDDNSSTGKTLEIASKALTINGANDIRIHVADIDLRRMVGTKYAVQPQFNPSVTAGSTLGLTSVGPHGEQMVPIAVRDRLKRLRRVQKID